MRAPLVLAFVLLGGRAYALDDGRDEPVPDIPDDPEPALGPDGTYGAFHDVRVHLALGAGSWSEDVDDVFMTGSRSGAIQRHAALRIDSLYSGGLSTGGGWIWGFGAALETMHGPLASADASLRSMSFDVIGGWALPLGSHLQLELLAVDQLGYGSMTDAFPGAMQRSLGGFHLALAGEANLVLTDRSGWQIAATGGVRYAETHLSSDDDLYHAKTTARGWTAGLATGCRF